MEASSEWINIPAYAAHLSPLHPKLPARDVLIKELRSLSSPFTCTRLRLPLRCAICRDVPASTCRVVSEMLPMVNEWLWSLAVEIHEVEPGRLALTALENDNMPRGATWTANHAAILLHCLLTRHRCVQVIEGLQSILPCYRKLFCDALRNSTSLTVLRLSKCELTGPVVRSIIAAISGAKQLKELSLDWCKFTTGHVRAAEDALSNYIVKTESLRTLNVAHAPLFRNSSALIESLGKNTSIFKLIVGSSVLNQGRGSEFRKFLAANRTLKNLVICSDHTRCVPDVGEVFEALVENSTLEVLTLEYFELDPIVALQFARVFSVNTTLREAGFPCCTWDYQFLREANDAYRERLMYVLAGELDRDWRVLPLVRALKNTKSLQKLVLAGCFTNDETRQLLEAAAKCSSLQELTFDSIMMLSVETFYRMVQETGVASKVRLGTCHSQPAAFVSGLQSGNDLLSMGHHKFFHLNTSTFRDIGAALLLHDRVTALELRLDTWDDDFVEEDASTIASYLSKTTALKDIYMKFSNFNQDAHLIIEGLSKNTTIEKLGIEDWLVRSKDIKKLCTWLVDSSTVYHLVYLCAQYEACKVLLEELADLLEDSYTLTYIRVVEYPSNFQNWQAVKQFRRRNLSLVECAAHFVLGSTLKRAAAAYEAVSWHPQLPSKVQQLAPLSPAEVSQKMLQCNRLVQMQFWQLAGIVKDELVCHERIDGRKQIDNLVLDAWLHVREYLCISDVLDETGEKRRPSRKRKRR
uniref:Nlr family card domain protein n=1 Tax=Rhipicephalus appendiculatus TaxID=34631 RepID=A0A131YH27_RHIAP